MNPPIHGVLALLLAWLVIFPAICGLGFFTQCALEGKGAGSGRRGSGSGLPTLFWLGWAALLLALPTLHLVAKIDGRVTFPLLALGYLGFGRRCWRRVGPDFRQTWTELAVALPGLVWIAAHAVLAPAVHDSGLYHFAAIRWAQEYPVVPGLGLLHGRLAFNQSFFLYGAFLNAPPLTARGFHVANSLPFAVLFLQLIAGVRKLFVRRRASADLWFCALLLPAVAVQGSAWFRGHPISSPTPDLALFTIGVVLAMHLATLARCPALARRQRVRLHLILLLAAAGVMTKLSFAGAAVAFVAGAAWFGWRSGWIAADRRALGMVAVATLGWMAHGVVTSGYPLYPSALGGLPVEWRIAPEAVGKMAAAIKGWARQPGIDWPASLDSWHWLGPWMGRVFREPETVLVLLFGALAVGAFLAARVPSFRSRACAGPARWLLVPIFPGVAGLVFWFVTAPDPRFLGAPPLAAAAWCCAVGWWRWRAVIDGRWPALGAGLVTCLLMAPKHDDAPGSKFDAFGWGKPPKVRLISKTTDSGVAIQLPESGQLVWDGKLPSTPYFEPRLELRGAKLRHGFKLRDATE